MPTPARRALPILALLLVLAGCGPSLPDVTPADIPRLEAALADSPGDPNVRTLLGIAQYRADRFADARNTLGIAVERGASSGAAFLYLGLASEAVEDWRGARDAYSRYLEVGRFDRTKEELESRLALLVRREMATVARDALAREGELAGTAPAPRSIAVLPFQLVADDDSLTPLGPALADMITTDLALAQALTVLERGQIQALVRELQLTEAGYTDPGTGARTGRLLGAEHVVQGAFTSLGEEAIRFDTDVLNTERLASAGAFVEEGRLEALFDLEKELVFGVLDVLGVELTAAEREVINENRTENLEAFLAYGRGLEALDRDSYSEAAEHFQQAIQLDPGFTRAQEEAARTGQLERSAGVSPQQLALQSGQELGGGTIEGIDDLPDDTDALLMSTSDEVNPNPSTDFLQTGGGGGGTGEKTGQERNPTQEIGGGEGVTQGTTFTILLRFRRPGS